MDALPISKAVEECDNAVGDWGTLPGPAIERNRSGWLPIHHEIRRAPIALGRSSLGPDIFHYDTVGSPWTRNGHVSLNIFMTPFSSRIIFLALSCFSR
jgi:hypothetical protein